MSEYKGYRLKIEGVVFPNSNMQKGSWNCNNKRKLINEFDTADGIHHENSYLERKVNIEFNTRAGDVSVHEDIAKFFLKKDDVHIEYWNDDTCSYVEAVCKIDDIKWIHENVTDDNIMYGSSLVKITEY